MAVPLKTLYLWHSGTLWWHCLGGSRTHQTSPICCQLLDRRTRLYSLRRKQTYCRINYSPSRCATREQMVVELRQCCSTLEIRVNKTGGRQPHRGFSWDPPAQRQSDGHRGGRWTSLSGATSEWAELCRETVRAGGGGVIVHGPNTMNPKAENAARPAAPCKFQQWLDARVMDDDPLLQHEGGVKDDGLHTKVRHHIYSGTETQAWTGWSHWLLGQIETFNFRPLRWGKRRPSLFHR